MTLKTSQEKKRATNEKEAVSKTMQAQNNIEIEKTINFTAKNARQSSNREMKLQRSPTEKTKTQSQKQEVKEYPIRSRVNKKEPIITESEQEAGSRIACGKESKDDVNVTKVQQERASIRSREGDTRSRIPGLKTQRKKSKFIDEKDIEVKLGRIDTLLKGWRHVRTQTDQDEGLKQNHLKDEGSKQNYLKDEGSKQNYLKEEGSKQNHLKDEGSTLYGCPT